MARTCRGRFLRNNSGSTIVEFAIIFPIFLALIFSILEAGWFFFVTSAVEQANEKAARLIRTGQIQNAGVSKADFEQEICNVVDLFGDCGEQLTVDVSRYASFGALAADLSDPVCRDADAAAVDAIPFSAGVQREVVRVRVCFLYKPLTPGLGLDLRQAADGSRKIVSVTIFRNEPYES